MKFGWRWFLPVFFLILFVMLAVVYSAQNSPTSSSDRAGIAIDIDPPPMPLGIHAPAESPGNTDVLVHTGVVGGTIRN
jgi:hypothetical protein